MSISLSQQLKRALQSLAGVSMWSWLQFVGVILLMTYSFLSMQIRYTNAEEIRKLREDVASLEQTYTTLSNALQLRVQALESTTYVDVLSELQKRPQPQNRTLETWFKNRDAAVDERLRALELWRWRTEEQK